MATQDAPGTHPAPSKEAVRLNRFEGVGRARRMESAGGRCHGRDVPLIETDDCNGHGPQRRVRIAARPAPTSWRIASKPAFAAELRAMNTTSTPWTSPRSRRTDSRIQRFTRLRTTALPTFLLTVRPNRGSAELAVQITTRVGVTKRLPLLCTRRKSARRRMRSARGRHSSSLSASWSVSSRSGACAPCDGDEPERRGRRRSSCGSGSRGNGGA